LIDLEQVDSAGFLVKREIADLLDLADPDDIGSTGSGVFTFPFTTIESVIPLGRRAIGVLNDNNHPFSAGWTAGEPDRNEFIVVELDQPLPGGGVGPVGGDGGRDRDHGHQDDDRRDDNRRK
jgi:hypothetical protein